jgi:endoglucanase
VTQAGTVILVRDAGEAQGYYYFALLSASTYLVLITAIVALHALESRRQLAPTIGGLARTVGHGVATATVAALLVVTAFSLRGTAALAAITSIDQAARAQDLTGMAHARQTLLTAASTVPAAPGWVVARSASAVALPTAAPAVALSIAVPDPAQVLPGAAATTVTPPPAAPVERPALASTPAAEAPLADAAVPSQSDVVAATAAAVHLFPHSAETQSTRVAPLDLPTSGVIIGAYDPWAQYTDVPFGLEHWFIRQDEPALLVGALAHARNQRTVLVTIEPFPARRQRTPVLDEIVAGKTDGQLRRIGQIIRDNQPQVVLVRWGHEMDLSGLYPWSANDPELYRAAFRHVASILREEGATNARLVWSPLASGDETGAFYPGDDVVDYVGLTVLGDESWDSGWGLSPQSFRELIAPKYARVAAFGKPVVTAELGVSGTPERQAAWLARVLPDLVDFPLVRAVSYFNDKNPPVNRLPVQPDWRLEPSLFASFIGGTR